MRLDKVVGVPVKDLALHRKPTHTLLFKLFFNDHLRLKAGVVEARDPDGPIAAHPVVADEQILDGIWDAVADVQDAVSIRWRHQNRVRLTVARRRKGAGSLPQLVDVRLAGVVVGLGEVESVL